MSAYPCASHPYEQGYVHLPWGFSVTCSCKMLHFRSKQKLDLDHLIFAGCYSDLHPMTQLCSWVILLLIVLRSRGCLGLHWDWLQQSKHLDPVLSLNLKIGMPFSL